MRLTGIIKTWNEDRGFGFISPNHGSADLFVHISGLPRDGTQPTLGETVTYEVGRGKDGRPQAVNVIRKAVGIMIRKPETFRKPIKPRPSVLPKLIGLILLLSLGAYVYSHYQKREANYSRQAKPLVIPSEITIRQQPALDNSRCDGRTQCSQMTSCNEAKYFLANCPGTQMDGNNDGVPCQQQWCTSPAAK